jgi:hypothetical protein
MAERHGKNSRILLDGVVVKMASFDIDMSQDTVEVTAFGDSNKRYVVGMKSFAATIGGFWDDATDKIFDIIDAGNPVNCYFYPDAVAAPTQYWWGSAYVDGKVSSGVSAAVAVSGTITAAGNFTRSGVP